MPLPPFVGLAHIDQHRTRLIEHAARFVDIDLFNRLARFVEDVLGCCHRFLSVPARKLGISPGQFQYTTITTPPSHASGATRPGRNYPPVFYLLTADPATRL